ncbi:MAG: putative zinc-binding metallopeptidase [Spirochaetales bacterium]|nr:putative zinc-binding metallopeptidase [Spirochaetales bacterium]
MKNQFILIGILSSLFLFSCSTYQPYGEPTALALYDVQDGDLISQNQEVSEADLILHQELWDVAMLAIPADYQHFIVGFRIESDGPDQILASVEPDGEELLDLSSWTLAVDLMDAVDRTGALKTEELTTTLIHEFAHILSLNSNQIIAVNWNEVDFQEDEEDDRYWTSEGIAQEDSYLNLFYQRFWTDELLEAVWNIEDADDDEEYTKLWNDLSIATYTDFITDYAMTNPEEDFAESFAYYVMNPIPEPTGTLSIEKVLFFDSFPEIQSIRTELREMLDFNSEES